MKAPRAYIHHYDDHGSRTKPAQRVCTHMCVNNKPPILEIRIPDGRTTKFQSVYITIAELRRALGS